jgi:hypothetical protein
MMALIGGALIIMSFRQMFFSLRSGSSKLRGGRMIKLKNHPKERSHGCRWPFDYDRYIQGLCPAREVTVESVEPCLLLVV